MTRSELGAALVIRSELTRLENSLADIQATGGIKSSARNGTRTGGRKDKGQVAAELAEEIAELRKELEIEQEIIRRKMEEAPLEKDERKVLLLRYVKCLKWAEIYQLLGYSKSRTLYYHEKAMEKVRT